MKKPVLILGASGFIGRRLVKILTEAGYRVVVAMRTSSANAGTLHDVAQIVSINGANYDLLPEAVADMPIGAIVNCAAYGVRPADRDLELMYQVNVSIPVGLVDLARQKKAVLIHLGSSAEYALTNEQKPISENAPPETGKPYGTSKYCGGVLMNLKARAVAVRSVALRLFNVYGPGEAEHRLFPTLLLKLGDEQRVALSSGDQVRDFVYVDDVATAVIAAMNGLNNDAFPAGAFFNISTGVGNSVRRFAQLTASRLNAEQGLLGFGDLSMRPDEVKWLVGSNRRFAAATGWSPAFSLEDGIQAAITAEASRGG